MKLEMPIRNPRTLEQAIVTFRQIIGRRYHIIGEPVAVWQPGLFDTEMDAVVYAKVR